MVLQVKSSDRTWLYRTDTTARHKIILREDARERVECAFHIACFELKVTMSRCCRAKVETKDANIYLPV